MTRSFVEASSLKENKMADMPVVDSVNSASRISSFDYANPLKSSQTTSKSFTNPNAV